MSVGSEGAVEWSERLGQMSPSASPDVVDAVASRMGGMKCVATALKWPTNCYHGNDQPTHRQTQHTEKQPRRQ